VCLQCKERHTEIDEYGTELYCVFGFNFADFETGGAVGDWKNICPRGNDFGPSRRIGKVFNLKPMQKNNKALLDSAFQVPQGCPYLLEHTISR
jgi:hypothetical protein